MMLSLFLLVLFYLSCVVTCDDEVLKEAFFLITGLESSGSEFAATVVHSCLNNNSSEKWYGRSSPKGYEVGANIAILHRSVPHGKYLKISSWEDYQTNVTKGYKKFYVIVTTRDEEISLQSSTRRFPSEGRNSTKAIDKNRESLRDIFKNAENAFIWNYETVIILGNIYAKKLYEFINKPDCTFDVEEKMFNGNLKYLNYTTIHRR